MNELPRNKPRGIRIRDENFTPGVTPECFYGGSTVLTTTLSHVEWVGGLVPVSPGFPLETCGNDGLRRGS